VFFNINFQKLYFLIKSIFIYLYCFSCLLGQTNSQIKQAKDIIKKSNMSEAQIRSAAKAQGFTDKQINDAIKNELNKKNTSQSTSIDDLEAGSKQTSVSETDASNNNNDDFDQKSEIESESKVQPGRNELEYFGYEIFKRDPSIFQASSVGAVDPDYLIGPADEIIVMLWGETQFRQVLKVDREGFIFIPEIGQVFVNGLNLNMLESKLFRVLSQSYASLDPRGFKATTFLDVSLGNLRPLRIQVLGEVTQPGAYTVSPSATLFSSLYYFNGPTTNGSLRDIKLIRADKEITAIDFYNYLLTGKKMQDQKLQLDDIIFIPKRMKTVSIDGEINQPGIFELKNGEGIKDLISLAGELKISAYLKRAQIDRIVPFEEREKLGMDRIILDLDLSKIIKTKENFEIRDGDRVQIFSILDIRLNSVEISGAVTRPGTYELEKSFYLSDLIQRADGLLGDAYRKRVDVVRVLPDLRQKLIKLDLEQVINEIPNQNIELQALDRIRIYSLMEMIPGNSVSIKGHVKNPGLYPLLEDMTLRDIIFQSGGFLDAEFLKQTYLERADIFRFDKNRINRKIISFNLGQIINDENFESDIILQPDDIINIYPKTVFRGSYSITISGAVKNPGIYNIKKNMTLIDAILEANGFDKDVYRYRIEISRVDPENSSLDAYSSLIEIIMKKDFIDNYISDGFNINQVDNPVLNPYDMIFVRPDPYFSLQRKVSIDGMVLYPGDYPILSPNETIKDIIDRAGGIRPEAYLEASRFIRGNKEINLSLKKVYEGKNHKSNYLVRDGDQIIIAGYGKIISINGEVSSPGFYPFESRKRVSSILRESGGLSPDADKKNIYIKFPNGKSKKYHPVFGNPKVKDGSVITVGKKPEEEPFDKTEYMSELSSIIANLAQAISLVILAKN
tara:strand:+ start:15283 stop:17991 length:2709 start_codon:yes stop_codon:yes gene_type:complete